MYSHPASELIPLLSPALKAAYEGIQDGSFSMANVLELATDPKFNDKSIAEWTYVHEIVMAAASGARDGHRYLARAAQQRRSRICMEGGYVRHLASHA